VSPPSETNVEHRCVGDIGADADLRSYVLAPMRRRASGYTIASGGATKMRYKVHRVDVKMTRDQEKLEQFLNGLEGEVVAIVPNVTVKSFWVHQVDFLLVVERVSGA
jgi:hypothetical protein